MNRYDMIQEAKKRMADCEGVKNLTPEGRAAMERVTADGFILLQEAGRMQAFKFLMAVAMATYEMKI